MQTPTEAPVMTLSGVTLFPQTLLPLHIFEPRYRLMLTQVLHSDRMFIVAMQKPGRSRETPSSVAGLGLVRLCVDNPDGTSHLILHGLSRVELVKTISVKPFRVCRLRALQAPTRDSVTIDALMAKVRDLVTERIQLGLPPTIPNTPKFKAKKEIISYLDRINDPDHVADVVSSALLPGAVERQIILETVEIEPRLKHLIHFLMAEISHQRKSTRHE
jgi:ATP-dependent Lon protease